MSSDFGKLIIIFGIVLIIVGILLTASDKIPLIGRLPGDVLIKRDNFTFYAPIVTSIIISIVLTIILNFIIRLRN